jgi:hypothetical protein
MAEKGIECIIFFCLHASVEFIYFLFEDTHTERIMVYLICSTRPVAPGSFFSHLLCWSCRVSKFRQNYRNLICERHMTTDLDFLSL